MGQKYSKVYTITTNFLDRYDDLTPASILDLLQDVSGRQAVDIGAGFADMSTNNLYWVIVRNEVKIFNQPPYLEDLTIITYPLPPTRFYFDREYEIRGKNNELYPVGRSRWLIIDAKERKMQPSSVYQYPPNAIVEKEHFLENFPSLTTVENSSDTVLTHKVLAHEIDHNLHYNNTRYAELIYDLLLPKQKDSIESFLVYYHHEVKEDEEIQLKKEVDGKLVRISGYNKETLIFNAQVQLR